MSWARLDDKTPRHPKLLKVARVDRWTWLELLCYCAEYGTGGRFSTGIREAVPAATPRLLNVLETVVLIERDPDGGDGYIVHDWGDYNPSDPTAADRMRRHRARNSDRNGDVTPTVTTAVTESSPRARASAPVPVPSPITPLPPAERGDVSCANCGADGLRLGQACPECGVSPRRAGSARRGDDAPRPKTVTDVRATFRGWITSPAFDAETMTMETAADELSKISNRLHVTVPDGDLEAMLAEAAGYIANAKTPFEGAEP